jgi:hypothetical protein
MTCSSLGRSAEGETMRAHVIALLMSAVLLTSPAARGQSTQATDLRALHQARSMKIAGGVLVALGAAALLTGALTLAAGMGSLGPQSDRLDYGSMAWAGAGLVMLAPGVLATGVPLLVAGHKRERAVRLLAAPTGVRLTF